MDRFLIRNNKKPNDGTQNSEPAPKKKKYDKSSVKVFTKQKKPHTIAKCLILPALVKVSEIMFDTKTATALQSIPVSNNTISRRIEDIASNIVMQVIEQIKLMKMFAFQLDKSTDVSGEAQVIVFVRYQDCSDIRENILFCQNLHDGAAALTGKNNGLMAWIRKKNPKVKWLHCIIHRQALALKRMNAHLHETLNKAVKVINFIKARPLNSRMFKLLCQEMGLEHQHLLLHTEVRWLSHGKILNRLFELRQEVHMFLLEQKSAFSSLFENQDWVCRLAYLADIFDKLNDLNLSMQGFWTDELSLNSKMCAFIKKLEFWLKKVQRNSFSVFPTLDKFADDSEIDNLNTICDCIREHLTKLTQDWIQNPFVEDVTSSSGLSDKVTENLIKLASDRALELKFQNVTVSQFWLEVKGEYKELSEIAMSALLPFGSTYLCEVSFSAMSLIKTKHRNRLSVQNDLIIAVSDIKPRFDNILAKKQPQVSHSFFMIKRWSRFSVASGTYNVRASEQARQRIKQKPLPKPQNSRAKLIKCYVKFLDDSCHEFEIERNAKGMDLLNVVFDHLDLIERDYFGLRFCEEGAFEGTSDNSKWLDPRKTVKKQLRGLNSHLFLFRVKFFVADPSKLKEDYTRYHYVLQIRKDLLEGRLKVSQSAACLLASYALQSAFGDYCEEEHGTHYVNDFKFMPGQTQEIAFNVIQLHKIHRGQSPATAEFNFLDQAKRLETYGMDIHGAKDSSGRDLQIGVLSTGIIVFQDMKKINTFSWTKIVKISFKRKQFFLQLRRELSEEYDTLLAFNLVTYRSAKNLWRSCVEHHAFFRLSTPVLNIPKKFLGFGSSLGFGFGSRFRFTGRTEYETIQRGLKRSEQRDFSPSLKTSFKASEGSSFISHEAFGNGSRVQSSDTREPKQAWVERSPSD
ncbi:hypothetical protein QYM36_013479, partial [Artemia franciscana]